MNHRTCCCTPLQYTLARQIALSPSLSNQTIMGSGVYPINYRPSFCIARSMVVQISYNYAFAVYISEADRPAPIPASEHEDRRKRKQLLEIAEVGAVCRSTGPVP